MRKGESPDKPINVPYTESTFIRVGPYLIQLDTDVTTGPQFTVWRPDGAAVTEGLQITVDNTNLDPDSVIVECIDR